MMELIQDCRRRAMHKAGRSYSGVQRSMRNHVNRPLGVGIIGCGKIAATHVEAFRATGGVEVVACVDVRLEQAKNFGERYDIPAVQTDFRRLFSKACPDIVIVCTWPGSHAEIACAAAEAGARAILVEKPMCVEVAEADAMIATAERTGATLVIGHQHRHNPVVDAAKRIIQSGQLGSPKLIHACCQTSLLNNGTHAVDTALSILGDPAVEWVWGQAVVTGKVTERGLPAEDSALAHIRLAGGITLILEAGEAARERFSATVIGTEGQLRLRFDRLELLTGPRAIWRTVSVPLADPHERQAAALLQSIWGHRAQSSADRSKGRRTHEILIGILASAATRQPVSVPLPDRDWSYRALLEQLCVPGDLAVLNGAARPRQAQ